MEEIDIVWKKTCQVFNVLDRKTCHETETEEDFEYIVQHLTKLNFAEDVYQLVLIETRCLLRQEIAPKFWKYFSEDCEDKEGFQKFEAAVAYLRCEYQKCLEIIKKLIIFKQACSLRNAGTVESEQRNLIDCFRSSLLSQLPPNFDGIIHSFYSTAFQIFLNTHQEDDDQEDFLDDIEINCRGCGKEAEFCRCQRVICAFNMTNMILSDMQLLDRLTGFTLTCLVQEKIGMHVNETCKGIFDSSHLEKLETWLDSVVLNWLTRVYNRGSSKIAENDETTKKSIHNFRLRLLYFLYETYANTIIDQFFNIIIDYPDSQPAIDDLKVCLSRLDLRKEFVENLKQSLESRLLHPGVNTTDILTGYVAAIKAIRHLDSSGVLLETITEPVKEYLRKRNDTVREVVTGLTEEGPTDLAEELARSEALKENVDISKQDDMANWESWEPDPVDAKRSAKPSSNSRTADIIAMVVDIYGSKELFVNEYRNLLADRMLSQLDFNPEKEIRNLELLKLRFGEALLRSCEVMIKDIGDSKRINTHIQSDINYNSDKSFEISSLILSSQFWPAFNKETLELPEEIQAEFKKYTTSYEAYKGNRTLSWRNVTGRVNIDIEIGSKTIDLTVTPTQAVIIYHFQTKPVWTLEELSFATRVPQVILRKRIMFWKTQGLLMETETDVYKLVDEGEDTQIGQVQPLEICEDEESESAMASASDQREEELQVFWSYIVGMLTNLDSLPIERIHQMLKMFASHGPGVEFSQDELKNFLQRKVREHKLMFVGGVYHLPK